MDNRKFAALERKLKKLAGVEEMDLEDHSSHHSHDDGIDVDRSVVNRPGYYSKIEDLIGETIVNFVKSRDEVFIELANGRKYKFTHFQDCCESVYLEDIVGSVSDLLNTEIVNAYESYKEGPDDVMIASWSFFHISTRKGTVTLRFNGTSNGYYSTRVSLIKIN